MKKIIVVTSSPRKGGNSETLAQKFAEGARTAGNEVELIAVRDVDLKFCIGCMYCQSHDRCVLNDGMNLQYEKFRMQILSYLQRRFTITQSADSSKLSLID